MSNWDCRNQHLRLHVFVEDSPKECIRQLNKWLKVNVVRDIHSITLHFLEGDCRYELALAYES